jgi:hypothetical protein
VQRLVKNRLVLGRLGLAPAPPFALGDGGVSRAHGAVGGGVGAVHAAEKMRKHVALLNEILQARLLRRAVGARHRRFCCARTRSSAFFCSPFSCFWRAFSAATSSFVANTFRGAVVVVVAPATSSDDTPPLSTSSLLSSKSIGAVGLVDVDALMVDTTRKEMRESCATKKKKKKKKKNRSCFENSRNQMRSRQSQHNKFVFRINANFRFVSNRPN